MEGWRAGMTEASMPTTTGAQCWQHTIIDADLWSGAINISMQDLGSKATQSLLLPVFQSEQRPVQYVCSQICFTRPPAACPEYAVWRTSDMYIGDEICSLASIGQPMAVAFNRTTPQDCCAACASTPGCKAWNHCSGR